MHSLALSWVLAVGLAQATSPAKAAPRAPVPAGTGGGWALSVTAPNGQRDILIGSMHVADRHLRQPDPRLAKAARVVVFEHPEFGAGAVVRISTGRCISHGDSCLYRRLRRGGHSPVESVNNKWRIASG
jgi:hypothetical protein